MADSGAAKIQSPTLRDCIAQPSRAVRLCFGKKCRAMRSGMQLCTTCTVWVSAGLPPSLPPCRTGPGSHSASQGATECLAESLQILKISH